MFNVTLKEKRSFVPTREFISRAQFKKPELDRMRREGKSNPNRYWAKAAEELHWFKKWKTVLKWKAPNAQWFVGGKLNAAYNCLDRHLETNPQKAALVWEGEPGDTSVWTYSELHREVETLTAALRELGLKKGDRIAIYLPLTPEAVVAMLACARGGFVHTVIFGGFSAESLKDRMNDSQVRCLITADGGYRKGSLFNLEEAAKAAVAGCGSVEFVIGLRRSKAGQLRRELDGSRFKSVSDMAHSARHWSNPHGQQAVKLLDWHDLLRTISEPIRKLKGKAEILDSEHPLFILYTSGTTGKPKGLVHTTGGYLTGVLRSFKLVFDYRPDDLYWCTADIGWITGHSYVVYGPLAAGATVFLYEGAPMHPTPGRFWQMIERHRITIFYTAPTAIRAFMRLDLAHIKAHDLSSLRLLGSVGEPINPEAWMWYRENIGSGKCPIVDTYWQTETGSIVISAVPGVSKTRPGSAGQALPGFDVDVLDKKTGKGVKANGGGYLVIKKPWPSMARTVYGDAERFKKTYWSEFKGGIYFTGDGAHWDQEKNIWCLGRVDDVLNVSGHRIGTMEVESALVGHPDVAEAAVVGRPDELKGQALVAYVTLKAEVLKRVVRGGDRNSSDTKRELETLEQVLKTHVAKEIGAIARPDDVRFADALPKTRSGKIMRRLLRELASSGRVQGDTTTLEDFSAVAALQSTQSEE